MRLPSERVAWLLALTTFVVGDVVTTMVGLGYSNVVEASPIPKMMMDEFGPLAFVILKLGLLLPLYLWVRIMERDEAFGEYLSVIPLSVAVLGFIATAHNTIIILSA